MGIEPTGDDSECALAKSGEIDAERERVVGVVRVAAHSLSYRLVDKTVSQWSPLSSSRIGARATLDARRVRCCHRRGRWRIPPEVPDTDYSVFGPYPLADHVHFAEAVAGDNDARVGTDYTPPSNRSTSPTAVGTSCAGLSSSVDAGAGSGGDPVPAVQIAIAEGCHSGGLSRVPADAVRVTLQAMALPAVACSLAAGSRAVVGGAGAALGDCVMDMNLGVTQRTARIVRHHRSKRFGTKDATRGRRAAPCTASSWFTDRDRQPCRLRSSPDVPGGVHQSTCSASNTDPGVL